MKLLRSLPVLAALSMPLVSGCSSKMDSIPLKDVRGAVPGITLFDEDKDGVLSKAEVRKYAEVVIIGDNKLQNNDEVASKLYEVRKALLKDSPHEYNGMGTYGGSTSYPPNIEQTITNFQAVAEEYTQKHYDEQDAAIAAKLAD